MKISIITVVLNAEHTIADAINSVIYQTHPNIEHILIDGNSTDKSLEIINQYRKHLAHVVSEKDDGLYFAMNKGIALASGDVIAFLNADDIYEDSSVLSQVAMAFEDQTLDACYADLVYVKQNNLKHIVRHWRSQQHYSGLSFRGWMPAHPTLFIKREIFNKVGNFNTALKYQSDLEFCTRLFESHSIKSLYIPKLWVRMRLGGVSNNSLLTMIKGNWESYLALKKLGLKRNPFSYFFIKFSSRLLQFFNVQRNND